MGDDKDIDRAISSGDISISSGGPVAGVSINSPGATVSGTVIGQQPQPAENLDQLRQSVANLIHQVKSVPEPIEHRDDLVDVAEGLAEQLDREPPNPLRIKAFLRLLGDGVRGIAPLATAVATIAQAIHDLLNIG
jgi:hypothetical protein